MASRLLRYERGDKMAEHRMPKEEDYPSNSNNVIEKKSDIEPMKLEGKVKTKRSLMKSVKDEFVNEDAPSIGNYILFDILFPALRDLVADIGHSTIDLAMGGRGYGRPRRSYNSYDRRDSYISYNRMYDDRRPRRRDRDDDRYERNRSRDLDDLIFESRRDAEDCLERMIDRLERYGCVSVADLYDIIGETVFGDWTKDDWGWEDLSTARIRKVRDGWLLDLPRVRPI